MFTDNRPEWLKVPEAAQPLISETSAEYRLAQAIDWRYDENRKPAAGEREVDLQARLISAQREPDAYVLRGENCDDGAWDCTTNQLALWLAVRECDAPFTYRNYLIVAGNGEWNVEQDQRWIGGAETMDAARDLIDSVIQANEIEQAEFARSCENVSHVPKFDRVSWQD